MASSRNCKLSADSFCYICGYYIGPKQPKHQLLRGTKLWTGYAAYFGIQIGDQDRNGLLMFPVVLADQLWRVGYGEIEKACHLPFLACGENQRTTLQTATSVWSIYQDIRKLRIDRS